MKTSFFPFLLLLCVAVLGFSGCDDDDNTTETLNYDGDNFTAPSVGAGVNVFAAYFPARVVQDFAGRRLSGVRFWLQSVPERTVVVAYGYSGNDAIPELTTPLYRIDLTQRINNTGWIDHIIPGGLDIPADGLWLAVETEVAVNGTQTIGCDAGNNFNPNGDRLLTPSSGGWTSFNSLFSTETVNWNIRGVLEAE